MAELGASMFKSMNSKHRQGARRTDIVLAMFCWESRNFRSRSWSFLWCLAASLTYNGDVATHAMDATVVGHKNCYFSTLDVATACFRTSFQGSDEYYMRVSTVLVKFGLVSDDTACRWNLSCRWIATSSSTFVISRDNAFAKQASHKKKVRTIKCGSHGIIGTSVDVLCFDRCLQSDPTQIAEALKIVWRIRLFGERTSGGVDTRLSVIELIGKTMRFCTYIQCRILQICLKM